MRLIYYSYTYCLILTKKNSQFYFTDSENHKIIKLERDTSQSFGISIVGGKVNVSENVWITGIFIKDIVPNSPADLSKQLKVCDNHVLYFIFCFNIFTIIFILYYSLRLKLYKR